MSRRSSFWPQGSRLLAALTSRRRAAYVGAATRIAGLALRPLDRLLRPALIRGAEVDHAPTTLMIVAPPRSGSTLIYQMLVRTVPCAYISNGHAIAPAFFSRMMGWLPAPRFGPLDSYYGHTARLTDVNEANELFDPLFRGDPPADELRRRFLTLTASIRPRGLRPVIVKNVRSFERLGELHSAIPEIIFLRVRRSREQVVQSVVRAFKVLKTFHPIPANLQRRDFRDPVTFAVDQIAEIEATLDRQLATVPSAQRIEWSYEEFCTDTRSMITELAAGHLGVPAEELDEHWFSEPLTASTGLKVTAEEHAQILALLGNDGADEPTKPSRADVS